jgi:uncharacterized protein (TIRG00374 family)
LKKIVSQSVRYLVFLSIGLGLLYLVFKDQDFNKLWEDIKGANYYFIAVSMIMGYLAIISRGLRWNILLKPLGYTPKKWNSIHAVTIGYFANLAVPRIGEVTRCTALNQAEKIPVDKLFGTVLLERVIDTGLLLVLLLCTFLVKIDLFTEFFNSAFKNRSGEISLNTTHYIILTLLIAGLLVLLGFRKKIIASAFFQKVKAFLIGIAEGFKTIRKIEQKGMFVFHTIFIWSMYLLMTYVCFFAFTGTSHLGMDDGLFVTIVGGLGMVAPAPGGIGAYHAAVIAGLTALEIDGNIARSFAVVIHSAQTAMMVGTGLFALIALSLSRRKAAKA